MTVGLVIVSHSARLAAGVVELAGQMAQGKTPIAAAGGMDGDVIGTSVERILAAIEKVTGPDGVLILLDLGSAILSTEMALEMLDEEQRGRVRLSIAPLVEGAVVAAVEASVGRSLAAVQQFAERTASVGQLRRLKPLSEEVEEHGEGEDLNEPDQKLPVPPVSEGVFDAELTLVLTNPTGLHARPASLFVQTANRFEAEIFILAHGQESMASSIIELLSLGLRQGDTFLLRASGAQAQAALAALSELVHANFYETESGDQSSVSAQASLPVSFSNEQQSDSPGEPWRCISISAGVAVGPAFLASLVVPSLTEIELQTIGEERIPFELQRLDASLEGAVQELQALVQDVQSRLGPQHAAIFEAQSQLLQDPVLRTTASKLIETEHVSAATALARTGERYASSLEKLADPLLAARAVDMRDVVSRTLTRLGVRAAAAAAFTSLQRPSILLARDLTPSDTVQLRPEFVLGICTVHGGPTAHAAILARALGIPALAGLSEGALQSIQSGDELGLDADNALLYLHPSSDVRENLIQRQDEHRQRRTALQMAAQQEQPLLSFGDRSIHLFANIGSELEAEAARQWGAQGIGLLRTEFLFARSSTLPNEDEQRQLYAKTFRAFQGEGGNKIIVARTLDAGADKPLPALQSVLNLAEEANPALGVRGIRIHLAHPFLLEQQLRALLLAAGETETWLRIMFPMIATVEELQRARTIFDSVYKELHTQGAKVPEQVPVGIMIEVPSAVLMARELATLADFFSIGANDLAQYTLAYDRTNPNVTSLYRFTQPALLRQISQIVSAGKEAGIPVAVCGEIASDTRLAPILVALGVDELSMTPTSLPGVRAALSNRTVAELRALAEIVLQIPTGTALERELTP